MKIQKIYSSIVGSFFFGLVVLFCAFLPNLFMTGRINLLYGVLFFWILTDPARIRYGLLFLISLIQDLFLHNYLGVHASLYAVFIGFLLGQRRHLVNRSFKLTWAAFSVTLLALIAIKTFTSFIMYRQPLAIYEFFLENIAPILLFPFVYRILATLYTRFLPKDA